MAGSVKQKIRLGSIFLFILLLLLSSVSIFHIVRLKNDSQRILKNNYESLDYAHAMLRYVDSASVDPAFSARFDNMLTLQEKNLTEPGEREATAVIRKYFEDFRAGNRSPEVIARVEAALQNVLSLNMRAIENKNDRAAKTANKALTYLSLIATIIFIIGVTFTFNFPSIITDPINAISEGIKQVTARNYHHRIHLDRKDEFGEMASAFNQMTERLEYFENSNLNKIIFEKTRAEAVINRLKDASIGFDKNGRILFANDQALQLLGLQSADIVGKPISEIAAKNDLFRFLLEEKNTVPFKVVLDNHENYFTKEISDISEDGSSGKVIVLKNITSFKELDVAKTNFIATISHELKTPLASSDFSIKLLEDERTGKLTEEQKEYVHNLKLDNQRMLRILSELLNMSQVEAGKIQLDLQPVAPIQIADDAISTVLNAAKEKNIRIVTEYEPGLPAVKADPEKTAWVLNNFLTNAIRYAGADSTISVRITRNEKTIRFSVADQGPGIPSEYLDKIFDRFFKVPGTPAQGTGLGLSISKEFIEAQQGKIWVKSEIGSGSTFGFDLYI
ncbi:MAG: HAMP domain-containing protein [Sphingobacteriales bacterium]|nr:HAMP domain-containing protein [Sphingobacteriales bacterium]OJY92027.1 MAG: PAS domain-containing sensor histidine kinase [Sphingobacteriales bacterium 44-15]